MLANVIAHGTRARAVWRRRTQRRAVQGNAGATVTTPTLPQPAVNTPNDDVRPTVKDVRRISKGDAARKRGTGSRNVAHRLNADEAKDFDVARQRAGYVCTKGTGYRRERGGAPLVNTWLLWCDAMAVPSICLHRGSGSESKDQVGVDTSPLRVEKHVDAPLRAWVVEVATKHGAHLVDDDDVRYVQNDLDDERERAEARECLPTREQFDMAERRVKEQGDVVRAIKEKGHGNQHPEVAAAVVVLKQAKAELEELHAAVEEVERIEQEARDVLKARMDALVEDAIWKLPRRRLLFELPDRATAKAFAAEVVEATGIQKAIGRAKQL
ncbi:hypothetical protein PPROV_000543700 [Pycnococcus provasolii]|uniref:Uncharacterized protein n=1 Tax=Pycnococcus provasolii TaxID=41880 RepID=A0A830HIR0_9CHLO|nr:hypothetical protein PPROV_000543700 [Pycnococcus provasolii]